MIARAHQTEESPKTGKNLGNVLFVSGSNFRHRLNSPARHLPRGLAPPSQSIDIVGYVNFCGGPPSARWRRLASGIRNVISNRVESLRDGATRQILVRRLHMPGPLEMLA